MEVRLRDDLASLTPYDPDMREVEVMLSANENSYGLPEEVRAAMAARLAEVPAHRYPEAVRPRLRALLGDLSGRSGAQRGGGRRGRRDHLQSPACLWRPSTARPSCAPRTFSAYELYARAHGHSGRERAPGR